MSSVLHRKHATGFVTPNALDLLLEADLALAEGNHAAAIFLVEEVYEAFDLAEAINEARSGSPDIGRVDAIAA